MRSKKYLNKYLEKLLTEYKKEFNKSLPITALQAKVEKDSVYKWLKQATPPNSAEYLKLIAFLEEKLEIFPKKEYAKEGDEEFGNPLYKTAFLRLPLKRKQAPLPNTDPGVVPGQVVNKDEDPELIVYRLNAPFLIGVEGALPVPDDSMFPTYMPGSYIAIQRVADLAADIRFGECYYIIPTSGKGFMRRVYQDSEPKKFKLVADNRSDRFPVEHPEKDTIVAMLYVNTEINNPRPVPVKQAEE